jgi:cytoskeletal protein CcmA (bactofilin family)
MIMVMALATLFLLATAGASRAFENRTGEKVTIAAGETIGDDLYVAAETFTLSGTVKGDVVAVGNAIEIEGVVEGDLFAAGQTVTIDGEVKDDVRMAGAGLIVNQGAVIGDDLIAAGYSLEADTDTTVGGDLIFGGSQALLAGDVSGNVLTAVNGLLIRGRITGNLITDVGTRGSGPTLSPFIFFMPNAPTFPPVPGGLTIADGALIGGDLAYTSEARTTIPTEAVSGQISYHQEPVELDPEPEDRVAIGTWPWFLEHLRTFVALLLVGFLFAWLIPGFMPQSAATLQSSPLPSLGWGIATVFAALVASVTVLVAMMVLALILGWATLSNLVVIVILFGLLALFALLVLFGFAVTYIAEIVVSYLAGRLILTRINQRWGQSRIWPFVVGLVALIILMAIPYLGRVVTVAVDLLGLGALWLLAREQFRAQATT